jgi:uncharacterized protein (TIGR03663 family)
MNLTATTPRSELVRDQVSTWQTRLAQTDWTPWLIIGFAALLRFLLLGIKPPHFDEGINGWFVDSHIIKGGFYRYDPTNYHGPLHFYTLFIAQSLFGRNLWALRLPVVLVSIMCVWLTFKFEPLVGRAVSRMAALTMAVSPAFVFYGRYSIHEVWLVLFSMMFILGLLGLWRFGRTGYLWCAGMGLTGMILTKETYSIHVACALLAIPCVWLIQWHPVVFRRRPKDVIGGISLRFYVLPLFIGAMLIGLLLPDPLNVYVSGISGLCLVIGVLLPKNVTLALRRTIDWSEVRPAKQTWTYLDLAIVIGTGIALIVFFYSGTFHNWKGLKGLYQAYAAWVATGTEGRGHDKPWGYWLKLIGRYELPIGGGLLVCLFWPRLKNVSLRYLAIYGVGTLVAYSIVKYKTPWCIISIVWPFLFLFGAALLISPPSYKRMMRNISAVLLVVSFGWCISLNYFRCSTFASDDWDEDKSVAANVIQFFKAEPYVYVQTYNDIFKLTRPVLELARRNPVFYQMKGYMIRASAYPFPWMLDDFPNVGYYEHQNLPSPVDADFLLVQEDKIKEIEAKLQNSYFTEPLTIRPYQDTSKLYLDANRFKDFFPGRQPEFKGKGPG